MSDSFILRKNNSNLKLKEMSYVICRNQGIITDIPVNKDYKIEVKFDAEDFNQESIFGITIDNSVYTHFTLYSNKYIIYSRWKILSHYQRSTVKQNQQILGYLRIMLKILYYLYQKLYKYNLLI